jgi:hypothetical protein
MFSVAFGSIILKGNVGFREMIECNNFSTFFLLNADVAKSI